MSTRTLCRLGVHHWTLWPAALRAEPGEAPCYCDRCGKEPRVL